MDVTILAKDCIKIKGKHSSFVIDPNSLKSKTLADGVLLLKQNKDFNLSKIEEQRVVIKGPGDYEISGVKISGVSAGDELIYIIFIDGIDLLLTTNAAIKKAKDKLTSHKVIILSANSDIDLSIVTALEPNVVIFYGDNANDSLKSLGKITKPVSKFSVNLEKLPTEMEAVLLE